MGGMPHPDLVAALAELEAGRAAAIIRIGVAARRAALEMGAYCKCAEPELTGADLLCGACLHQNRDQERRAVDRLVNAHEFVSDPAKFGGRCCAICAMGRAVARHHGVDEVGRCSWGERRLGGQVAAEEAGRG
jgi:hypothetical protein